jgi:hypothetical protein
LGFFLLGPFLSLHEAGWATVDDDVRRAVRPRDINHVGILLGGGMILRATTLQLVLTFPWLGGSRRCSAFPLHILLQ